MTDHTHSAKRRNLLRKILERSTPLKDVCQGIPFDLLRTFTAQTSQRETIEPPTYGFEAEVRFLETMIHLFRSSDRWVLATLISELTVWVWEETHGRGESSQPDLASVLYHLGVLPVMIPHPDYCKRLGVLVERIALEGSNEPLVLELRSNIDDRIFSIYGLTCAEIRIVVGDDVIW